MLNLKILFILNSYHRHYFGGSEYQACLIARALAKMNYQVFYMCLHCKRSRSQEPGITLYTLKRGILSEKLIGETVLFRKVRKMIRFIQPDVIYHRNLTPLFFPGLKYCRHHGKKSILHLAHEKDLCKMKWGKYWLRNFLGNYFRSKIIQEVDRIVAQTRYQDRLLRNRFERRADLIFPNVHPRPTEKIVKKPPLKVLWVANLKRNKQPEKFVELAERMMYTGIHFIMIGRDTSGQWMVKTRQKMRTLRNLDYLGELDISVVNRHLSGAHVFVNTSVSEGFPNTFVQAWMRRVPVVSLQVDPDNILQREKIGFCSRDLDHVQRNIQRLADDADFRHAMGCRAQQYAFRHHSLDQIERITNLITGKVRI